MQPARLRPYQVTDLPALFALDQVCFQPGIAYSRAELRSFLEHPSSFAAVACISERIVGFVIVRPARRPESGTRLWRPILHLLTIDVSPEVRRQGVGALMMHWVLEQAQRLGSQAVMLEVAVNNEPAQEFYRQFNFVQTRTLPGYYNGRTDALELQRTDPLRVELSGDEQERVDSHRDKVRAMPDRKTHVEAKT